MFESKLTPEDVTEMQRLRDTGSSLKEIAERFEVSKCAVSRMTHAPDYEFSADAMRKRANWPEWILWDNMHKRYGKRVEV